MSRFACSSLVPIAWRRDRVVGKKHALGTLCLIAILTIFTSPAHAQGYHGGGVPSGTPGGGTPPPPPPPPDTWVITYVCNTPPDHPISIVGESGVPWYEDYAGVSPYPFGGGEISGDPGPPSIIGHGSVTCRGTITTTVAWSGPDPVPAAVLLEEDSIASWYGDVSSGYCDAGLPVMGRRRDTCGNADRNRQLHVRHHARREWRLRIEQR